jgi:hypothetical protein
MSDNNNVIKFGKAAKAVKRARKEKQAAENRARFGQKKAQKDLRSKLVDKINQKLDAHRLNAEKDKKDEP